MPKHAKWARWVLWAIAVLYLNIALVNVMVGTSGERDESHTSAAALALLLALTAAGAALALRRSGTWAHRVAMGVAGVHVVVGIGRGSGALLTAALAIAALWWLAEAPSRQWFGGHRNDADGRRVTDDAAELRQTSARLQHRDALGPDAKDR